MQRVMTDEEWAVMRNDLWSRSSVVYDVIVERIEHLRNEVARWEHTLLHRLEEEDGQA